MIMQFWDGFAEEKKQMPLVLKWSYYSSVAMYLFELVYASFILHKLIFKNERSRSLILATSLIMMGCLSFIIFFAIADMGYAGIGEDWNIWQKMFYLLCYEFPFLLIFLAHWIIFYQYLELAVVLPVLVKIADYS